MLYADVKAHSPDRGGGGTVGDDQLKETKGGDCASPLLSSLQIRAISVAVLYDHSNCYAPSSPIRRNNQWETRRQAYADECSPAQCSDKLLQKPDSPLTSKLPAAQEQLDIAEGMERR